MSDGRAAPRLGGPARASAPLALAASVRKAILEVDSELPVARVRTPEYVADPPLSIAG